MTRQAAAGMLHLEDSHIIHRDLALRNLLVGNAVDGGYLIKISDFGLSRSIENAYYKTHDNSIAVKWCAPEVLEYGTHTSKSDVYSFGILLWELFSFGKLPFAEYTNDNARMIILKGVALSCPDHCPPEIYTLMTRCWDKKSDERPNFSEIYEILDHIWQLNGGKKSRSNLFPNQTTSGGEYYNTEIYNTDKSNLKEELKEPSPPGMDLPIITYTSFHS